MQNTAIKRHKLTVDDYHRMGQAGILSEDERVELIEGELIDMAPIGSRHAECVSRLTRVLIRQTDAVVRVQDPIRLPPHSEPQPDIAVVKAGVYAEAHPGPADVLLLIEVAETSLDYDRSVKIPLYARHGVAEVWLIDLQSRCLERHRDPRSEGGYADVEVLEGGAIAQPALLPEVAVKLAGVLG